MNKESIAIKIQDGCSQHCAYCIVRKLRGMPVSISYDTIYNDIRLFSEKEHSNRVYLTGVNTLEYFDESVGDICGLLKKLLKDFPDLIFSLEFINPFFTDRIFNLMDLINANSTHLVNSFCISIQSASNKILKAMHRPYTSTTLKEIFDYAKRLQINICTEVIVGFPGETEEDFQETYDFIKSYNVDFLAFIFSPRSDTEALSLPNQIPESIKENRMKRLRELKKEMGFDDEKPILR